MTTELIRRYYPESRFGGFSDVDGTVLFYARVRELTTPSSVVLDIGCGRGAGAEDPVVVRRQLRQLRGHAARVIGIDVDEAAAANPLVDEFHLIRGQSWNIPDSSVDVAVADWVLEHVDDPNRFLAECFRVLRPHGVLCMRTANAISYVGLAARLVPGRWQARALRISRNGKAEQDVFETRYRCNTVWRLRTALRRAGFEAAVYGYESEPHYLGFSSAAYWLGRLHQRHAPGPLRCALFAFASKPESASP